MKSFVDYSSNSDFSIHNIPFGVAVFNKEYIGCCTRIGDQVIDLATLYDLGYFEDIEGLDDNVFEAYTINEFIELGKPVTNAVRTKIQTLLQEGSAYQKIRKPLKKRSMILIR
jgi:fumarylacetoacetase